MSFNQQIIEGHVGSDPESRQLDNGVVTNFSVATSTRWTDKKTGEKRERTTWHRVSCFNRLGEIARDYVRKGSNVLVIGETVHEKYTDKKTGEDRYSTKIIVNNLQLLGGRQGLNGQASSSNNQQRQPAQGSAEFDSDIPF